MLRLRQIDLNQALQTVLFPGARNKVKNLLGEWLSRNSTKHGACGGARARSRALKGQD